MWLGTAWKQISRRNITVMRQVSGMGCVLHIMSRNQILYYAMCENQHQNVSRMVIRAKSIGIIQMIWDLIR